MDGKGRFIDNIFVERLWRSLKYEEVVCYERDCRGMRRKRCFTKDEGRPLGVGLQERAPNRHKLRGLTLIAKEAENAKQPHWAQARSSCWGTRSPPL